MVASPLQGVRVLDFSRLVPGPHCTALLQRMGAEVIKIEDVGVGDLTRVMPPRIDGTGLLFSTFNRGKQSVAVDLKHRAGQTIVQELARQCQIVVEGFRPGVVERLGIDFATLSRVQPHIVYCSISGYGQHGMHSELPGHDLTYAAMTGLLDALSAGTPRVPGVQIVDAATALLAAARILGALHAASGPAQFIDVALTDGARELMPGALEEARLSPKPESSVIDMLRGSPRYNVYECSDRERIAVAPLEDVFWHRFIDFLYDEELLPRGEEVTSEALSGIFRGRQAQEWFVALSSAGVPSAPVRSLVTAAQDASLGDGPVPALGEHTVQWLVKLGYTFRRVAELTERGIVHSSRTIEEVSS